MNDESLEDLLNVETKERPRKSKKTIIRKFRSEETGEQITLEMDEKGNVIRQL